jgi:N-acetyl sugar amidotransferase
MPGPAIWLSLDHHGHCRFCRDFDAHWPSYQRTPQQVEQDLAKFRHNVRSARKTGSPYDGVLGVSGGVDSSYLALLCKQLDLNPLLVHFDNGWNSKTAVDNIRRMVDKTGFDLETYVIDWPEFRDLQRSFFRAGVVDIELLTDNALVAATVDIAKEHRIRSILRGANYATEHGMPPEWAWAKYDWRNIKAIHRKYGEGKIRTFPHISTFKHHSLRALGLGGKIHYPLELVNYRKGKAMDALRTEFGWEYYGGKHYESTFTKFYQAYILPRKFGIDKRPVHLSSLVRNGELPRQEALEQAAAPLYLPADIQRDRKYVCKKLGFTEDEFDSMMQAPPRSHAEFPSDQWLMGPVERFGLAMKRRLARRR